jgi:hypothetical protein
MGCMTDQTATERIGAALALHPPCHDPDPAKWAHAWDCRRGHSLEDGQIDPDEPPLCTWCTYDARSVPWPCPTVQALTDLVPLAPEERQREAVALLMYALHLRMHGERAPGGHETWAEFDRRCEDFLRRQLKAGRRD